MAKKVLLYDPTTCHIGDRIFKDIETEDSSNIALCPYDRTSTRINPEAMEYQCSIDPRKPQTEEP